MNQTTEGKKLQKGVIGCGVLEVRGVTLSANILFPLEIQKEAGQSGQMRICS